MASGAESLALGLLGDIDTTLVFFDFMILQDVSGCASVEGEGQREYMGRKGQGERKREREGGWRERKAVHDDKIND